MHLHIKLNGPLLVGLPTCLGFTFVFQVSSYASVDVPKAQEKPEVRTISFVDKGSPFMVPKGSGSSHRTVGSTPNP